MIFSSQARFCFVFIYIFLKEFVYLREHKQGEGEEQRQREMEKQIPGRAGSPRGPWDPDLSDSKADTLTTEPARHPFCFVFK